jgi:hypothetical protein
VISGLQLPGAMEIAEMVGKVGLWLLGNGCDVWVVVAREMAGMVRLRLQSRASDIWVVVAREMVGIVRMVGLRLQGRVCDI